MATYDSFAYECSRENATIVLDEEGTEWINEFPAINLEVGDTVRVLGTFVNEASSGNTIEITDENNTTNITFSPYIKGNTIGTADAANNLVQLGTYGDIVSSTDSFGIEPPCSYQTSFAKTADADKAATISGQRRNPNTGKLLTNPSNFANDLPNNGWLDVGDATSYDDPEATSTGDVNGPAINIIDPDTGETKTGVKGAQAYFIDMNNEDGRFNYMNGWAPDPANGNTSITWGTNIKTGEQLPSPHNYNQFAKSSVPNDFYISSLCKKIIIPVFDDFMTANLPNASNNVDDPGYNAPFIFGSLKQNVPTEGIGCLDGAPRPGFMICSADIGDSSGWFDQEGNPWQEVRNPPITPVNGTTYQKTGHTKATNLGRVNLKGGPLSIVGKILAVRPIIHYTSDSLTRTDAHNTDPQPVLGSVKINAFEIYVYDFFNPSNINRSLNYSANQTNTFRNMSRQRPTAKFGGDPGPQLYPDDSYNTTPLTLTKQVHGAPEFEDGYSLNPTFNNLNGPVNSQKGGFEAQNNGGLAGDTVARRATNDTSAPQTYGGTYQSGSFSPGYFQAKVTTSQYGSIQTSTTQVNPGGGIPKINNGNGEKTYNEGADDVGISKFNYGYGKSMGLSFLWAGSDCGSIRYPEKQTGATNQYRSNTISQIGNLAGRVTHKLTVINYEHTADIPSGVPPAGIYTNNFMNDVAGLICCSPETMEKFINGTLADPQDPATPNTIPRVWFPFTNQIGESDYAERHYKGNGYEFDTATQDAFNDSRPFTKTEQRYNVPAVGVPLNINWRSLYSQDMILNNINDGTVILNHYNSSQGSLAPGACYSEYIKGGDPTAPVLTLDTISDCMPRYYATGTGCQPLYKQPNAAGGQPVPISGGAFHWGGYNNSNLSIHFQQPQNGRCDLSKDFTTTHESATATAQFNAGVSTINLTLDASPGEHFKIGSYMYALIGATNVFATTAFAEITATNPAIAADILTYDVTINYPLLNNIDAATDIKFSANGFSLPGGGTTATQWQSDLLTIKEHSMKLSIPKGFYSPDHLSKELDRILHDTLNIYKEKYGVRGVDNVWKSPTTVGFRESAFASVPSVINSNMLQTYIPSISYGFTPVTTTNATLLEMTASTKELTNELLTYDTYNNSGDDGVENWTFYYPWNVPNTAGGEARKVTQVTDAGSEQLFSGHNVNQIGKHTKIYSIPFLEKKNLTRPDDREIHLFSLKGGALAAEDYDPTVSWENKKQRFQGYEPLRVMDCAYIAQQGADQWYEGTWFPEQMISFAWRTRFARNLLPYGGGCKVFCGANDPTIEYNEVENRIAFSNLYTPIRPHESENASKTDFGVGDAIPSAIINARQTGMVLDSLCGIYINNLNASAITKANYGTDYFGTILYDTLTDSELQLLGTNLLNKLGFNETQVSSLNNDFSTTDTLYTFFDRLRSYGKVIRNFAQLDSAVNATNPAVSSCLNIAPVRQYFAEINSDEVLASDVPELGQDPYYLVGSDFPSKNFHGSKEGQKLPIIGICARNFQSFNFVFDLGGSSISYTIDENKTIKSIKTKIYTSTLQTPQNLSKYSSVIYLITKQNYIKPLPEEENIQAAEMYNSNKLAQIRGLYYNPSTASHRTEPPAFGPPKGYYESSGSEAPESDYDSDTTITD